MPEEEGPFVSEATQQSFENRRWLLQIVLAVAIAGASSAALSLIGFKGSPVLVGGGWVSESHGPQSERPNTR
jgi:hypothetical protein